MDEPRHRLAHVEQRDGPPQGCETTGRQGGPPGPLGQAIPSDSDPPPVEFAWDRMRASHRPAAPLG